jgi:MazG family protein
MTILDEPGASPAMMAKTGQRLPLNAGELIDQLNGKAANAAPLPLEDLLTLMAVLRDPQRGCPWDREQTFATIAPYTIEEAYEVADAIARGDPADLKDELGDLLLQVVYHAQMASEDGAFDFAAIADAITRKMIRRHPHVFGDDVTRASIDVRGLWDRVKAEEAKDKRNADGDVAQDDHSILRSIPAGLPALPRAVKLQKRAAKVGFDWSEAAQIFDKMKEEIAEFEADLTAGNKAGMEEEFGDLLFVLANLARRLSIDPETALRNANAKFERRFQYIEHRLRETERSIEAATLDEMERLWNEAKSREKSGG